MPRFVDLGRRRVKSHCYSSPSVGRPTWHRIGKTPRRSTSLASLSAVIPRNIDLPRAISSICLPPPLVSLRDQHRGVGSNNGLGYVCAYILDWTPVTSESIFSLGTAVGLNLLFGIALLPSILLTSLDFVVFLLAVPKIGRVRLFELFTVSIVGIVLTCFAVDVALTAPPLRQVLRGLVPTLDRSSIYTAVSLLGANVMPHNFYLHSALVKSRHRGNCSIESLCKLNLIDVTLALGVALLINLALLVVSASTFHSAGTVVFFCPTAKLLLQGSWWRRFRRRTI